MIAVDTNLLVYAHREDSAWHQDAHRLLANLAEGAAPWLIPWPCLHEFLAIVTHPRIYLPPTPLDGALRQAEYWLESPTVHLDGESPGHFDTLARVSRAGKIAGGAMHDARIAAICIDH